MRSKKMLAFIVVIVLAAAGGFFYYQQAVADPSAYVLSGTVEATEINIPTISGGMVRNVYVAEGDSVQKGQTLVNLYSPTSRLNDNIPSPIDGVVLERLVEPDEYAAPGSTILVVASLDTLTLKIYVPEDRYGQVMLGAVYPVTTDSFPGQTFEGKVSAISSKAEFTPRNVQTTDSRKTTVYAVKLDLGAAGGMLKPGMPADVHLDIQGP